MPAPPNIRFTATGRNGANNSRMKSASKRMTLHEHQTITVAGELEKRKYSVWGRAESRTSPFCKLAGCNESKPKSAPRALVMAIISGLCFCCTADRLRHVKRSAIVFACDGGRTAQGMARIVVVRREKGFFGWRDTALPVKIDREPLGEVVTGGFACLDRPAGPRQLSAALFGWPGTTRHDITAAPG